MPTQIPTIALGGSASGGGGSSIVNDLPDTISEDYAQLLVGGSIYFAASGARLFNMDAGAISTAFSGQIGRVIQGVTVTESMVADNQRLLDAIGTYCRENDIQIHIEAQLDNVPQQDWTYQWLEPAAKADLPITAVEDDDEIEVSNWDYTTAATNMTSIVAEIVNQYPEVQIGQWECQAPLSDTDAWWSAYNTMATAERLPTLSYIVADTSWNAPWVTPPNSWQAWLRGISSMAQASNMHVEVLLGAVNTDATGQQWTAQSEQHAAMLAGLDLPVSTLLVRTWNPAEPNTLLPITDPATLGNDAAEIAATYPLYEAGSITAQGGATLSASPQLLVVPAELAVVPSVQFNLGQADIAAGACAAIVVIDQAGSLSASAVGDGTVTGIGTNVLTLSGNVSILNAELNTLELTEPAAGPDTLDIEAFGANGRLADIQISVLATTGDQPQACASYSFQPQCSAQTWIAATATLASTGSIASEQFFWNATDQDSTGAYQLIQTVSIHEPLAELGVAVEGGIARQQATDPATGGSSLPVGMSYFNPNAFDPAEAVSTVNVLATVLRFGPSGSLQTITNTLASTTPTATIIDGTEPDYFATGGTDIIVFNTGDNPDWQPDWSNSLSAVATILGSNQQVLEQVFYGGSKVPWLVVDDVFSPYTGALWEQFQTSQPDPGADNFVTGNQYVTQFNTGDNPNWDATDWGTAPQVRVTWQDYYAVAVATSWPGSAPCVSNSICSTLPALVTINAFYSATPSPTILATAATATSGVVYYTAAILHNIGYSDPNLWTIMGSEWSADPNSSFYATYSAYSSDYTNFISVVYQREFGHAPSAQNLQNLLDDVPGVRALLSGGGHTASPIQVVGGIYGYLLYVGQTYNIGEYAYSANAFLNAAAMGSVVYGPELTSQFPQSDSSHSGASATGVTADQAEGASANTAPNVVPTALNVSVSNQNIDPGPVDATIQFLSDANGDTLVLHAGSIDQIVGFDPNTDALDLRPLLAEAGIDLSGDFSRLGNYASITKQGQNAILNFDPTGQDGGSAVAVLHGLGGTVTSLNVLVGHGAIQIG